MSEKSVIIIGAGIAGLSAGCYARMNGYRARIYEMHTIPGGLMTAWKRRGYTIDLCIHWLVGSNPESYMNRYWQEVGLVQNRHFIDLDEFTRVEGPDGKTLIVYTNLDRLQQHLLELAPEDEAFIREMIEAARRMKDFAPPPDEASGLERLLKSAEAGLKLVSLLPTLKKWGGMSMAEFAARFKNPFLHYAFEQTWPPELSAIAYVMTLAWLDNHDAGYPIGGSYPMARAVEKRFLDMDGEIFYNSRVSKILVEDGRAVGVRLANGDEQRADIVISAADGHATIFDMLEGRFIDDKIRSMYRDFKLFAPMLFIGLGVKRTFENEPRLISGFQYPLEQPLKAGDQVAHHLDVRIMNYDPTLSPQGKTVITVMLPASYEYWTSLREADLERYDAEKKEIGLAVARALDKRYPGLEGQVEMIDIATPATLERFTGNWRASWEGWQVTPENASAQISKTLPGLESFYMVGQWVQPGGGLPSGVMTARDLFKTICKQDGKEFTTSLPPEGWGAQIALVSPEDSVQEVVMSEVWRAVVDVDKCRCCGECEFVAPDVYELNDDCIAQVKVDPLPAEFLEQARKSVDACPEKALSVVPA